MDRPALQTQLLELRLLPWVEGDRRAVPDGDAGLALRPGDPHLRQRGARHGGAPGLDHGGGIALFRAGVGRHGDHVVCSSRRGGGEPADGIIVARKVIQRSGISADLNLNVLLKIKLL